MSRKLLFVFLCCLAGVCLMAQEPECALTGSPTIAAVVNSGSFQPGISANGLVSIFGSGFAPAGTARAAGRTDFRDGKFPAELACVSVEVAGQRAPVLFVSGNQINAQAPALSVTGAVEVRVLLNPGRPNEVRSAAASTQVQTHAPAFFTFAGRSIAAQHSDFGPLADPATVPGGRPARPGDVILLYGTGFGGTVPAFQPGEIPDRPAVLRDSFSISIGGVTVRPEDILYAGLSPGSISGLYQFNVRVPASVSEGDALVVVQIAGARTQAGAAFPVKQFRLLRVPGDFANMQAAVNAANPGDVIQVGPGRYNEKVVINKSGLRLLAPVGSGTQRAVVDGTGLLGNGIHVLGTPDRLVSGVEVMGFVVQNFENGVVLENAVFSRVHLNTIQNSVDKVEPWTLQDANGIFVMASHFNHIVQNFLQETSHDNIVLVGGSSGNTIQGNRLAKNGFDAGIPWSGPWRATTLGGCGILLAGTVGNNNNRIIDNEFLEGHWGILVNSPSVGNLIVGNRFHRNLRAGVSLRALTAGNLVLENDATGNGLANVAPSLRFDLFDDSTARTNVWIRNQGTANF